MPFLMDEILREVTDRAYEAARLWRNGVHPSRERVSSEMLGDCEACGEAMRFVDARGRISWKATPKLRDYLLDLQLDAEDDLEDI
jgi:hypothetical protein